MQFEWIIAALGIIGTIAIIAFVVAFLIYGFCLGLALGPVNGRNRGLGSTFVTAFFISLTYLILLIPFFGALLFCIAIILQWYIIKSRHDVGWGGAIVAWIITIIIVAIVVILLVLVIFGGLGVIFNLIPVGP